MSYKNKSVGLSGLDKGGHYIQKLMNINYVMINLM